MGREAAGRWLARASGPRSYRIWSELDGAECPDDPDCVDLVDDSDGALDYPAREAGDEQACHSLHRLPAALLVAQCPSGPGSTRAWTRW